MTVTLTFRFGKTKRDPSAADMQAALEEIYREKALGLPEPDLEEHPNSWLSLGYGESGNWVVVTLDAYRDGDVHLVKYRDQDDAEPVYELMRKNVGYEDCFAMWRLLAVGGEEDVRGFFLADGT